MRNSDKEIEFVHPGVIADMFNIRSAKVRAWAKAGKIPSVRLPNGRFVFDRDAVIAAVENHRPPGKRQTILTGRLE